MLSVRDKEVILDALCEGVNVADFDDVPVLLVDRDESGQGSIVSLVGQSDSMNLTIDEDDGYWRLRDDMLEFYSLRGIASLTNCYEYSFDISVHNDPEFIEQVKQAIQLGRL